MNVNVEKAMRPDGIKATTVLVNWCQPERTLQAVDALSRQSYLSQIIVVDNGSTDESVDILRDGLSSDVIFIHGNRNLGFGAGCNMGIAESNKLNADYIWLVNNDALPEPNCLELMMKIALADSAVGVVGSVIKDPFGHVPDHAGSIMNGVSLGCRYTLSSRELNDEKYGWITGASMLLNVNALRQVGSFSPKYFMYWEDADLCMRIKRHGYRLEVASDAIIYHEAGTSSNSVPLKRHLWHLQSQNLWVWRNHSSKWWAVSIIFFRNVLKSMLTGNLHRLMATLKYYRSIFPFCN